MGVIYILTHVIFSILRFLVWLFNIPVLLLKLSSIYLVSGFVHPAESAAPGYSLGSTVPQVSFSRSYASFAVPSLFSLALADSHGTTRPAALI